MRTPRGRRAGRAGCALLLSLGIPIAVVSCTDTGPSGRPGTSTPVPHKTTPVEICTSLVSYWAGQALRNSTRSGIDWEQKGLSNEQFALHEEVVAAARAEERRHGRPAALELIAAQVAEKCAVRNGATGSSENWRPPEPARSPSAAPHATPHGPHDASPPPRRPRESPVASPNSPPKK
ncbi:hypothetical protein [Streptomyces jumonjinensis]|uniref:Lipoprotein n=1 Tax=Streptomyces jumonjinensis TaxID=1945 RepID=A0A646KCG2_STRJU|nr:hypothetical protein [Streptomyces jumonjinensis]MQS99912.1 hypothetical protein [Streptomyces jumonjinensis]